MVMSSGRQRVVCLVITVVVMHRNHLLLGACACTMTICFKQRQQFDLFHSLTKYKYTSLSTRLD